MRVIHEMKFVGRLASGADEWSCPTCGRRVTLRRLPEPELTVLDPGDETAVHVGVIEPDARAAAAADEYGLGPVQEIPRPPRPAAPAVPDEEDRRWLAEIGIDWDGGAAA
ncbi:hypothetical protein [Kitasatospora sp. A2-31]|uniref:hypothetical protein n=1 Tax=Kitasatospora sp. A2-31 TaxID=2916414 RepID=UPI001EEBF43D|nr:hypothetical protein [Kitasatospora sp. A2-31]MCG6496419.1 hypothetical protein [Kitasatospora sp. A2-31]